MVDVFSYLGIQVSIDCNGTMTFKQQGLIQKILKYCDMKDCNSKCMPAATALLGMDANGARFNAKWDYVMEVCYFTFHQIAAMTYSMQ